MSSTITIVRSPPASPAVSIASFKSIKTSTRVPRRRVVKAEGVPESSSPSMQSWFTKVVRSNTAPSSGDAPGPLEQLLVVAFAVVSSHAEGELWQQRVYWCLLILAAASFLSVCLYPPGSLVQSGLTGMIGRVPRRVFDFIILRWPSIIATSLAYRGLVLVALPMSFGYLLSLVFCCYRFTMYLVYVITYLSFTFPLSTLLLLPLTILVGPTYLKWTVMFVGWSIIIYIAISALIGMYTANTITQGRWRCYSFQNSDISRDNLRCMLESQGTMGSLSVASTYLDPRYASTEGLAAGQAAAVVKDGHFLNCLDRRELSDLPANMSILKKELDIYWTEQAGRFCGLLDYFFLIDDSSMTTLNAIALELAEVPVSSKQESFAILIYSESPDALERTLGNIRIPSFLAWRLDHFGKRSYRKKSSSKQKHHYHAKQEPRHHRLRPATETPEPSPEFSTPASVARASVVSLKSEVRPVMLDKEGRDRIVSLASQSTVASMGRTGSGSSFMNDSSPSAGSN
ncbi:hypothetical protein FOL47_010482 [Perkinsus chesapeaki]|uniref:Uncharacterized protein n=1 Tax=Perkinsus chesapeaki TaxID=330153 RepID=A0A7J6L2W3_PERCH|nr:hypothetical protein FOL47_010482 [Perkinsus chesapeaki]